MPEQPPKEHDADEAEDDRQEDARQDRLESANHLPERGAERPERSTDEARYAAGDRLQEVAGDVHLVGFGSTIAAPAFRGATTST